MSVVINEMEVVPAESQPPAAQPQPSPAVVRVRMTDLERAQRRLLERAIRVQAH